MCVLVQVGVVSDFDLLAMDRLSLRENDMFPSTEQSWQVRLTLAISRGFVVLSVLAR